MVKTWCYEINKIARRVSAIHQFAEYHSAGEIRSLGRLGVVDFARLPLSTPHTRSHGRLHALPVVRSPTRANHRHAAYPYRSPMRRSGAGVPTAEATPSRGACCSEAPCRNFLTRASAILRQTRDACFGMLWAERARWRFGRAT